MSNTATVKGEATASSFTLSGRASITGTKTVTLQASGDTKIHYDTALRCP